MVLVLGDVRQQGKIAECPDQLCGIFRRHSVQRSAQFLMRCVVLVAPEPDRHFADRFDLIEDMIAMLCTDGLAEQSAKLADVASQ